MCDALAAVFSSLFACVGGGGRWAQPSLAQFISSLLKLFNSILMEFELADSDQLAIFGCVLMYEGMSALPSVRPSVRHAFFKNMND